MCAIDDDDDDDDDVVLCVFTQPRLLFTRFHLVLFVAECVSTMVCRVLYQLQVDKDKLASLYLAYPGGWDDPLRRLAISVILDVRDARARSHLSNSLKSIVLFLCVLLVLVTCVS